MSTPTEPNPNSSSEPLLFVGLVVAVITAGMTLLVEFGIELSSGQQTAIVAVITAAASLVTAFWGRSKVYSPLTVATLLSMRGQAAVTTEADDTTVEVVSPTGPDSDELLPPRRMPTTDPRRNRPPL